MVSTRCYLADNSASPSPLVKAHTLLSGLTLPAAKLDLATLYQRVNRCRVCINILASFLIEG